MEQNNKNTITIDTTKLENCRGGVEDKLYGIDNTIKEELLKQLDKVLNNLQKYNGKEITKNVGLNIDFYLYHLNEYIDKLNENERLIGSLVFGIIKSVIEGFREEYYKTIGIDVGEEKEEDVSINRIRYFDKYLNSEKERFKDICHFTKLVVFKDINMLKDPFEEVVKPAVDLYYNIIESYIDLMNISKKTKEQQEVYFNNKKSLRSKSSLSSSSEDYDLIIEDMEEVVSQTNSRSSSPVNGF